MTTKMRLISNDDLIRTNKIIKTIKETGHNKIRLWEMCYTGTSSDSSSEMDAADNEFDGSVPALATITCDTRVNSIGSEYITWIADDGDGTTTTHYFYWDKAEITEVTCLAKSECTAESTFHFYVDDGAGSSTHYYCWINVSGSDSDPNETGTAIECDISGDTSASDVATTVAAAINTKGDVTGASTDDVISIINGNNGNVTDTGDGEGEATGFSFSIEQGGDDPSATGSGHSVDISSDTTAANVADALATVINGVANITSSATNAVVTVENDNDTADITDCTESGNTGVTISQINTGTAPYGSGYLFVVSASANDDYDAASPHAKIVKIIGWDGNNNPIEETVQLDGTTYVQTTNKFQRVSHMYCDEFGAGGSDAADAITLETTDTTNGTTIITIAQGETESNGSRIYCPPTNYLTLEKSEIANITNTNTGTTLVKANFSGFENKYNTDPDFDYLIFISSQYSTVILGEKAGERRTGTETATISFTESEMGTEGNEDFDFRIRFITYQNKTL